MSMPPIAGNDWKHLSVDPLHSVHAPHPLARRCTCACHTHADVKHIMPCCQRGWIVPPGVTVTEAQP